MRRAVGLGIQSFEKIRQRQCFYIDKTDFIRKWWENADDVTLITRPRRFGKTLSMSMLEQFLSVEYAGRGEELFEGLTIWKEEIYRKLQGTYPVIFLSLADVKEASFTEARKKICQIIENLYNKYDFLLDSGCLFVLGLIVDLSDPAYILEFKVRNPKYEKTLEETVLSALAQIKEKKYVLSLEAKGVPPENIRCYGFAFEGKTMLIGQETAL